MVRRTRLCWLHSPRQNDARGDPLLDATCTHSGSKQRFWTKSEIIGEKGRHRSRAALPTFPATWLHDPTPKTRIPRLNNYLAGVAHCVHSHLLRARGRRAARHACPIRVAVVARAALSRAMSDLDFGTSSHHAHSGRSQAAWRRQERGRDAQVAAPRRSRRIARLNGRDGARRLPRRRAGRGLRREDGAVRARRRVRRWAGRRRRFVVR